MRREGMTELRLLSSMAPRELLKELAARYEQRGAMRISLEAAGGVDVAKRVRAGEPLDIVVLARNSVEELAREGALALDSVADIAASGIGVAVRAGTPRPPIDEPEALRQTIVAARSLSYSTGPSGVYLEKLFASWGILQDLKSRIVVPPPGVPVGSLLKGGKVELGFQQLSELVGLEGIEVLGPLPAPVQLLTQFSGAVSGNSRDPAAARAVLAFMSGTEHAPVRTQFGMQ
jgi:molybdate transport system substrate-binding protein